MRPMKGYSGWGQQTRCWQKQFCRLPPFLHNCTVALGCGISRRGSDSWIWHQSHAAVCFTNIIWEIKQSNEEFTQPFTKIHYENFAMGANMHTWIWIWKDAFVSQCSLSILLLDPLYKSPLSCLWTHRWMSQIFASLLYLSCTAL